MCSTLYDKDIVEHLPTIFENYVTEILANLPELEIEWETLNGGDKKRLKIKKSDPSGFDVIAECETYGLYPFAGEWHGPAWELWPGNETLLDLCEQFMGFIRSLLCSDSKLEVKYAGGSPYKWVLTYPTEEGTEFQEIGLFFYNYFGRRTSKVFQNHHLPSRYR